MTPVEMLGLTEFPRIGELPYFLTLGGYAFYWFRLQQAAAADLGARRAERSRPKRTTRRRSSWASRGTRCSRATSGR